MGKGPFPRVGSEGMVWSSFKGISRHPKCLFLIEANLKDMTQWYLFPLIFAKFYPLASPLCFRDCSHIGSVLHIWWECPKIRGLWNKIFSMVRKVTEIQVTKSPHIALLNVPIEKASTIKKWLIHFIFLEAKLTFARAWKRPFVSFAMTKKKILWIMAQEKMISILQDTEPWADYIHIPLTPQ